MATDYKKIAEEHRVGYGSFKHHRSFFYEQLYKEKTHCIYELIQNAVDSKSSQLELRLKENELFVWNDGDQFSEKDVRNICSLGSSSKDLTQIGTFGIGFKSVYNYTDCPEIYSGNEHFCIRDLTQPEGIDKMIPQIVEQISRGRTVFRLPFKDDLSQEDIGLLKDQFCKLGERYVLLFLRDLQRDFKRPFKTIKWIDERDDQTGICSCIHHRHSKIQGASEVELTMSLNGENQLSEMFLVFHKVVQPPQYVIDALLKQTKHDEKRQKIQKSAKKRQPIEIAFKLHNSGSITAIDGNCVLFAYLPTQKETHLKFLIQARYQTTSGREGIQSPSENPWNRWLVQETAKFLPEILEQLKAAGLLEPAFFSVLPLNEDNVPSEFLPIAEALQKAMQERAFVPTEDGRYAKAENVFYPHHGSLRKLVECSWIYPNSSWLHADIGRSGRAFRVMREAKIKEINFSQVLNWLEQRDCNWFKTKSNEWLRSLYNYLNSQQSELERIKKLPLVRLENGRHVCASEAFFPPETDEARKEIAPFLDELPILQSALLEGEEGNDIKAFLDKLDVEGLDPEDMIGKWILPQYSRCDKPSKEQNLLHVRYIFKVWDKLSGYEHRNLKKEISETPILQAYNGAQPDTVDFVKPCDTYLPQAYTGDMDLETYFSVSNGEYWFVDGGYLEGNSDSKEWFKFLKAIDAMDTPLVIEQKIEPDSWDDQKFSEELAKRNIKPEHPTRWPEKSITDRYLYCLPEILNKISKDNEANLARSIWHLLVKMVKPLPSESWQRDHLFNSRFQGIYHWFRNKWKQEFFDATFYRELQETAWLPDEDGKLHLPSELFAPTEDNRRVLGESVAYLRSDFDVSQDNEAARWLADSILHVNLKADTNSVLNYLGTLSGTEDTEASIEKVLPLYRFLEDQGARREAEFKAKPLIFIFDPEPNWWKSDEVFWENESAVFGNHRGYLKENYADYERTLKPFFIALGVTASTAASDYARVIREVASGEKAEIAEIAEILPRVEVLYGRLWQSLREGGSSLESKEWQEEWERTLKGRCWLGKTGDKYDFFSLHELVWKDDDYRSRLFKKEEIPFWAFDKDLLELAKCLGVKGCYELSEVEFNYCGDRGEDQIWSEKVQNLYPYIYDFLNSPRLCEQYREEQAAEILKRLSVHQAQRLEVRYRLNEASVSDPNPRQSFLEKEKGILWLGLEEDEEAYPDLIGDALQDDFRIDQLREFVKDLLPSVNLSKTALLSWKRRGFQADLCLSPSESDSEGNEENLSKSVDERLMGEAGGKNDSETNNSESETPMVHEGPETGSEDGDSTEDKSEAPVHRPRPSRGGARWPGGSGSSTPNRRTGTGYGGGGGGEGDKHRTLKKYLSDNPSLFGEGLKLIDTEYRFGSGDEADILFEDSSGNPVTVEVKPPISSGSDQEVWQAVKYKHLAAVKYGLPCEQVRSILAAPQIPDGVKEECKRRGIEPFEVTQR
ncbi:MAG: endonuclease NucS [Candidatus Poribacteria bacterium]|nr:endonuclease NucS [Candidatus Poribacteria bacterium]